MSIKTKLSDKLEKIAIRFLTSKDYFIRPHQDSMKRPKKGDRITFITGGAWKGMDHYITDGVMVDLDLINASLKPYGYIRAEKRDVNGGLIASHIIYPRDVIKVES